MAQNKFDITKSILKIRRTKGFSQLYIATKLGISQQAYQKIESGATKIGIEHLPKLAEALEVELVRLIQPNENEAKIVPSQQEIKASLDLIQHQSSEIIYLRKQYEKLLSLFEEKSKAS